MDKGIDYYRNLQYDVLVRKKGDMYSVIIAELSLVVQDRDLNAAYAALQTEKEEYFNKMIAADYHDYIREPEEKAGPDAGSDLAPFLVKFGIMIVTLIFIAGLSGLAVMNTVPRLIKNNLTRFSVEPTRALVFFNNKMENKTDEEKEALRRQIRKAVQYIKPFTDELRLMFDDAAENRNPERAKSTSDSKN